MPFDILNMISIYGLVSLLAKAMFILMISYSLYDQFEFSPASVRHNIWLLSFISLALLPLLSALLPSIAIPILSAEAQPNSMAIDGPQNSLFTTQHLIAIYLVVIAIRLLSLIYEVFHIAWVSAHSIKAQQKPQRLLAKLSNKPIALKISADIDSALTWGNLSPVILLPERSRCWSQQELNMVLMHEIAHIQRRDWLSQILGQLVCILYWPIPGIQAVLKKMSLEAERSADDEVLRQGNTAPDYASLLVKQARITHLQAAVALGKPSELNLRVNHIVSRYIDRSPVNTLRRILISCCWMSLIPLAALKTTASISPTTFVYHTIPASKVITKQISNNQTIAVGAEPVVRKLSRPSFSPAPLVNIEMVTDNPRELNTHTTNKPDFDSNLSISHSKIGNENIQLLTSALPKYPTQAINRKLEGFVVVEFDIDIYGNTKQARIIESSHNTFKKSALKAISEYQYKPIYINNEKTEVLNVKEKFQFRLSNSVDHAQARASPE